MSKPVSFQSKGTSTLNDEFEMRMTMLADKTAGLCTKYVSTTESKEESDSDSEFEVEATDNLLGRLRRGMKVIETHARETIAKCDTEESRVDMAQRLEKATLKMLRAEKSFMNTTRIIAEVVDEFASTYEDEETDGQELDDDKTVGTNAIAEIKAKPESDEENEASENNSSIVPIFRPTMANSTSIRNFGSKLSAIMKERMTNYEVSLTDDVLRCEKKFQDLQKQIVNGSEDAERRTQFKAVRFGAGDMDELPSSHIRLDSDDEEDEYDESVLPSTDPITLQPISIAVRNKLCNHVFDRSSIFTFMINNPNTSCPMEGCRNEVILQNDHFVLELKLTEQIRKKNEKLYKY